MRYLFASAIVAFLVSVLPTAAHAQGGAAINPVTVDGAQVYPALYSAQYRSALTGDTPRGADGRPVEWWRFLGSAGGCAAIRVDAPDFTPRLQLRDGAPSGSVLRDGSASLTVPSLPGSDWYYVRVGTNDGRSGPYTLSVDRC